MATKDDKKHVNLDHAREDDQREVMEKIKKDDTCPFCLEKLKQYHTKPIKLLSNHWILTENAYPYPGTKYHYLLISRNHYTDFNELSDDEKINLFEILNKVQSDDNMKGGTLIMRWGDTERNGATVVHLHAQLIVGTSREEGDGPILTTIGYKVPGQD